MIKKKFKSTVLCCAFHPSNGQLLATGCADFKCRVFSTFIADVDGSNVNAGSFGAPQEFGEAYCELSSLGWVHAVAWSPSGNALAYAGHDSTIHIATSLSATPVVRSVRLQALPMTSLLFVSESVLAAAGHDFTPQLFTANRSTGDWSYFDVLDKPKALEAAVSTNATSAARELFKSKTTRGQDAKAENDELKSAHESTITCICNASTAGKGHMISTSGLDGKLVIWNLPSLEIDFARLGL